MDQLPWKPWYEIFDRTGVKSSRPDLTKARLLKEAGYPYVKLTGNHIAEIVVFCRKEFEETNGDGRRYTFAGSYIFFVHEHEKNLFETFLLLL